MCGHVGTYRCGAGRIELIGETGGLRHAGSVGARVGCGGCMKGHGLCVMWRRLILWLRFVCAL